MPSLLKTTLISASALTATILMASPLMTQNAKAGMDGNPFEGLYLGLNANYAKVDPSATYTELNADTSTFNGITSSQKKSGYGGTIYGGIGTNLWGPMYIGIEGGLGLNGGSGYVSDGTKSYGLKAGFSFDLNTRLGMTISDRILVYGLGGYTSTKYSGRGFDTKQSKSLGGYRYGAGFEVGILEDIALRIEYIRSEHSAVTWTQAGDSFRFDPSGQIIKVGLILHMD